MCMLYLKHRVLSIKALHNHFTTLFSTDIAIERVSKAESDSARLNDGVAVRAIEGGCCIVDHTNRDMSHADVLD